MAALMPVWSLVPLLGFGLVLAWAWIDAALKTRRPDVLYQATPFNTAVLARVRTLAADYKCVPFFTNGHAETILAAKLRSTPGLSMRREFLPMADGGCVALDWEHFDLEEHVSA